MPLDPQREHAKPGGGLPPGVTPDRVEQLKAQLRGGLVRPEDADYEERSSATRSTRSSGASPRCWGGSVELDGLPHTVVGVMP
ncbi:hypothetical protein ACLESO_47515, partial [Pyxidicoccus sp. 3LG]